MATASKTPVAAIATVLLVLIAAAAVAPASASSLTIYRATRCRLPFPGSCGACYNFGASYYKGYYFDYYGGQVARFYYGFNCQGPYITVARDARRCISPTHTKVSACHAFREVYTELASS